MQIWSGGSGLAGVLHDVWGAFAGGSAPGADGLPAWPGYDTGRRATMVFDSAGSAVVDDPQAAQRRIWDGRVWESGTWWPSDG
jgi:para-nitrobenzyl esterase